MSTWARMVLSPGIKVEFFPQDTYFAFISVQWRRLYAPPNVGVWAEATADKVCPQHYESLQNCLLTTVGGCLAHDAGVRGSLCFERPRFMSARGFLCRLRAEEDQSGRPLLRAPEWVRKAYCEYGIRNTVVRPLEA